MTGIHAKYDKIWVWKDPHKNYSLEKKSWAKWSVKIKELAVPAMDHCRSSLMFKKKHAMTCPGLYRIIFQPFISPK